MPVGFAVIIIVSLLTPAPDRETQELVEHVRYPNLAGDTMNTVDRNLTVVQQRCTAMQKARSDAGLLLCDLSVRA